MIPAPVYACSVHMLGAWFLVTEAGAIACPTRAIAERVRQLLDDHGMYVQRIELPTCPDSVEGMPWG